MKDKLSDEHKRLFLSEQSILVATLLLSSKLLRPRDPRYMYK